MRPIDADRLMEIIRPMCGEFTDNGFMIDYQRVLSVIDSAPTIDAVSVVRCKDCKHNPKYTDDYMYGRCVFCCEDDFYSGTPDDDFYCGNGERRTDE